MTITTGPTSREARIQVTLDLIQDHRRVHNVRACSASGCAWRAVRPGYASDPEATARRHEQFNRHLAELIEEALAEPAQVVGVGPIPTSAPVVEMILGADSLEEAIGLSVGAASACWDNLAGAGTFESQRAADITATLLDMVRGYVR